MGQKVNAISLRIGTRLPGHWKSIAYTKKLDVVVKQDLQIREVLKQTYAKGQIGDVIIERPYGQSIILNIYAKKAAMIIGRAGKNSDSKTERIIDRLKRNLAKALGIKEEVITVRERSIENKAERETEEGNTRLMPVSGVNQLLINVYELAKPNLSAQVLAETVAAQIEDRSPDRIPYKSAMKGAVKNARTQGAKGAMIQCSGRLGGAELARCESYREGRVPLHTLRADIDYACVKARTTRGIIGVKAWIYR